MQAFKMRMYMHNYNTCECIQSHTHSQACQAWDTCMQMQAFNICMYMHNYNTCECNSFTDMLSLGYLHANAGLQYVHVQFQFMQMHTVAHS